VDESMITGEPVAVEKKKGEKIFAGTVNQKGSFQFEAKGVGRDTFLAHIIKMVREAQGSKAPVQMLVDKIAGIFVPVIVVISVLTFIAWVIAGGPNGFSHGLLAAVTVLVIACPCALGLATPTAIMVGVGKGAENHILIKNAESMITAHRVNAIVLDKTGTITEGKPAVTDMEWAVEKESLARYQSILYALEMRSEHPLADAVNKRLKDEKISPVVMNNFESITGRGVKAIVDNETWFVGNWKLMRENNIAIDPALQNHADTWQQTAKTTIYFSDSKNVRGVVAIADQVKQNSKAAIRTLQQRGIDVYMLTGDNVETAKAVAEQVGITHYHAEVLPNDKATFVKQLQQQNKVVAMVGDGINDSQALAQADVSIAMGKGSDIAMDVASMTLITSDLQALPKALKLSGEIVNGIRQNLFWAFIYNIIGIPLAAGVLYPVNGFLLDPMVAGAAMALSSLSVVANSLRLKAKKI
jgi:Cu2+-exporting ATPase